jgi:hypothetical protein
MTISSLCRAAVSLSALALLGGACAHVPATTDEGKPAVARPEKVFVTGSHIAQRVDPRTGEARTDPSLRIYSREQLLGTGRQGDLGDALRTLDPGLSP